MDSLAYKRQDSLRSPLRYPGGKNRVAKMLLEHMPPHTDYREIFAGGAALFFSKPRVKKNWLNDLHPGLCAFYRAVQKHFDQFAALCRQQDGSLRARFDEWAARRDLMDATGDEMLVERAVQYYFLNRTVWGGRVVYDPRRKSRLYFSNPSGWSNLEKKLAHLSAISEKLRGVKITCDGYQKCLAGATADTLIYADPPYFRESVGHITDRLYDKSFDYDCHRKLAALLKKTKAKVMVSYDDCPEIRELYKSWNIIEKQWRYCGRYAVTLEAKRNGVKEKKVLGKELLILNY